MEQDITNQHRLRVVRAWQAARAAGEQQPDFCARMSPPISTRTLRAWSKGFAVNQPPAEEALRVVEVAVERLVQLRDLLTPASAVGRVTTRPAGDMASRESLQPCSPSGEPAGVDDEPPTPPASPAASQPLPEAFSEAGAAPGRVAAHGRLSEPAGSRQAHRRYDWNLE